MGRFNFTHNGLTAAKLASAANKTFVEHRKLASAAAPASENADDAGLDENIHANVVDTVRGIADHMASHHKRGQKFNMAVSGNAHPDGTDVHIYITKHYPQHDVPDRVGSRGGLKP